MVCSVYAKDQGKRELHVQANQSPHNSRNLEVPQMHQVSKSFATRHRGMSARSRNTVDGLDGINARWLLPSFFILEHPSQLEASGLQNSMNYGD
jgi:hypothetical protein